MTEEPSFAERILAEVNALLQRELEANRKEIKSLKGRFTKVSHKADDINMLELQGQLNALNTQVKALRQDLLTTRRNSASNAILNYTVSLQGTFALTGTPTAKAMFEYITGLSESALKRIQETTDPERVTQEVYATILDHMKTLRSK